MPYTSSMWIPMNSPWPRALQSIVGVWTLYTLVALGHAEPLATSNALSSEPTTQASRTDLWLDCTVVDVQGDQVFLVSDGRVPQERTIRIVFGRPQPPTSSEHDPKHELEVLRTSVANHLLGDVFLNAFVPRDSDALAIGWASTNVLQALAPKQRVQRGQRYSIPLRLGQPLAVMPWKTEPQERFVSLGIDVALTHQGVVSPLLIDAAMTRSSSIGGEDLVLTAWTSSGTEVADCFGRTNASIVDLLVRERPSSDASLGELRHWIAGLRSDFEVLEACAATALRFTRPDWPERLQGLLERAGTASAALTVEERSELLLWGAWSDDVELLQALEPEAFVYGGFTYTGDHEMETGLHRTRTAEFWRALRARVPSNLALMAVAGGAARAVNLLTDDLSDPHAPISMGARRGSSLLHFAATFAEPHVLKQFLPSRFRDEVSERNRFLSSMPPIAHPFDTRRFGNWLDLRPMWMIERVGSRQAIKVALQPAERKQTTGRQFFDQDFDTNPFRDESIDEFLERKKREREHEWKKWLDSGPGLEEIEVDYSAPIHSSGNSFAGQYVSLAAPYNSSMPRWIPVLPLSADAMGASVAWSSSGIAPYDICVLLFGKDAPEARIPLPSVRPEHRIHTGHIHESEWPKYSIIEEAEIARIGDFKKIDIEHLARRKKAAPVLVRDLQALRLDWRRLRTKLVQCRALNQGVRGATEGVRRVAIQGLMQTHFESSAEAQVWAHLTQPPAATNTQEEPPKRSPTLEDRERSRREAPRRDR